MTLEEVVKHCEKQEEKHCSDGCEMEHKQLAEWLKELQYYRNIWKDPTQKPKEGEIIIGCCKYWEDVICGVYKIINKGLDSEFDRLGSIDWGHVKKWAYLKDVFPYRCYFSDLNSPVRFNETRIERNHSSNRALESHQAWEQSLLIADRIRGSF